MRETTATGASRARAKHSSQRDWDGYIHHSNHKFCEEVQAGECLARAKNLENLQIFQLIYLVVQKELCAVVVVLGDSIASDERSIDTKRRRLSPSKYTRRQYRSI